MLNTVLKCSVLVFLIVNVLNMVLYRLLTDKVYPFLPDDIGVCKMELSDQTCGFYTGIRICLLISVYNI